MPSGLRFPTAKLRHAARAKPLRVKRRDVPSEPSPLRQQAVAAEEDQADLAAAVRQGLATPACRGSVGESRVGHDRDPPGAEEVRRREERLLTLSDRILRVSEQSGLQRGRKGQAHRAAEKKGISAIIELLEDDRRKKLTNSSVAGRVYPDQPGVRAALEVMLLHVGSHAIFRYCIQQYYDVGIPGSVAAARAEFFLRVMMLTYCAKRVMPSKFDEVFAGMETLRRSFPQVATSIQSINAIQRAVLVMSQKLVDPVRAEEAFSLIMNHTAVDGYYVLTACGCFEDARLLFTTVVCRVCKWGYRSRVLLYKALLRSAKREGSAVDAPSVEQAMGIILARQDDPRCQTVLAGLIRLYIMCGNLARAEALGKEALQHVATHGMLTDVAESVMRLRVEQLDVLHTEGHTVESPDVVAVVEEAKRLFESVALASGAEMGVGMTSQSQFTTYLTVPFLLSYTSVLMRVADASAAISVWEFAHYRGLKYNKIMARNVLAACKAAGVKPPDMPGVTSQR